MKKKISTYFKEDSEYKGPKGKFWKFWSLMAIIMIGFLSVVWRLFSIQVIDHEKYENIAKRQHESKIDLRADRGNIYDRSDELLATTFKTISIAVDPTLIEDKQAIVNSLARDLGTDPSKYLKKINRAKGSFAWLERGISPDRLFDINTLEDKGLIRLEEPKRNFPYRSIGAQIIGFTNIDNKGISGLEMRYDSILHGRSGFMHMYRDGLGRLRPSPELKVVEPVHGNNIELTLDIELQRIVEYELRAGMERTLAEAGTVIVLKPQTGEILAIASYPMFDPYNIDENSNAGMRLRGVTDILEPGSTFKMVTAAIAIEEGVVDEDEILNGHNGVAIYRGGARIADVHGMGKVTFREAMQNSSNIILGEVANRLPSDVFYKYIRDFGFGLPTDVDLPGEVTGSVPKPKDFHANTKRYMGHGYGLNASPLQVVNSYAALANGGNLMRPYIIKKITTANGEIIKENKPEKVRQVVSEKTAVRVKDLLVSVVDSGSGKRAQIDKLKIAGKTGTSQKITNGRYSKSNYNASFAGFFPADNPELAMIVIVENPRRSIYGGYNSAPIFKNIAARWMMSQGYYKTGNYIEITNDSIVMPNLIGLSSETANEILEDYNFDYTELDDGRVIYNQFPQPNQLVKGNEELIFTTGVKNIVIDSNTTESEIKHDVTGFTMRRAISVLQSNGIAISTSGHGYVRKQVWKKDEDGKYHCKLICSY